MENMTTIMFSTIIPQVSNNTVTFSWYDYVFFVALLTVSAMIGIYFGCFGNKQSTTSEYLLGGKSMKVFPIAMSLTASHVSGITLLAVPADVYTFGANYILGSFCYMIMVVITSYIYLPVYFKLQIKSTYEYLERRFDSRTRMFSSFLCILSIFLFLPIVIYIPALAFSAATGINVHYITPIVCGVCIFYTTIGGLKAVVWTDTLQFSVTIGAIIAVVCMGVSSAGGFGNVWSRNLEGQRLDIFNFDLDMTIRDNFWGFLLGYTVNWIATSNTHQGCVQKYISVPTLSHARLSCLFYGIGILLVKACSVLTGLIMYAKYYNCDPFETHRVQRKDQLLPYYVLDVARNIPGLSGLFIAGVFSTALSTLSANLNSLSGILYEDFVKKWMPKNTSEKSASNTLKLIVIISGVICTVFVYVVEHLGNILPLNISLSGVATGPLLGIFTLGVLVPKSNGKGAFFGGLAGLLFVIWIVIGSFMYKSKGLIKYDTKPIFTDGCEDLINATVNTIANLNITTTTFKPILADDSKPFILFRVSYYYYTLIGCTITMILGVIISSFTNKNDPLVSKDLLSPIIHRYLPKEEKTIENNLKYYSVENALKVVNENKEEYN